MRLEKKNEKKSQVVLKPDEIISFFLFVAVFIENRFIFPQKTEANDNENLFLKFESVREKVTKESCSHVSRIFFNESRMKKLESFETAACHISQHTQKTPFIISAFQFSLECEAQNGSSMFNVDRQLMWHDCTREESEQKI